MTAGVRPRLWPTLIAAPLLVALLGLGTWQVQRLHWKAELTERRAAALAAPPLSVDAVPADPAGFEFRRIRVSGRFLHEREMLVLNRTRDGAAGVHVVTPLRLAGGGVVLVNRGWVPQSRRDPAQRAAGQVDGPVDVAGVLRVGGRSSGWLPDNRPQDGAWYYVDIGAMAAHAGLSGVKGFVVDAGPEANPGGFPIGGQTRWRMSDDHLQYAVTWYALAVALIVIYVLYHRRRSPPAR